MLTVNDMAQRMEVSAYTVRKLCADGTIPANNVGASRRYRIWVADDEAFEKFLDRWRKGYARR